MDEDLFSEFDEDTANSKEESKAESTNPPSSESSVKPSEVLASQDNPYEGLTEDQQIILGDMANFYSLNVSEVIVEFNKAYVDKSLNRFNSNRNKKFDLAKAIMKSILDEKAKVKCFLVTPIGRNVFYAKEANMVISTIVALMQYEVTDKKGATKIVKKRKSIKGFDKVGESVYQSIKPMVNFYNYEPMLKRDKKDEFTLSEFTSFEHGTPPEGKMSNMTDLEIYKGLKIKPHESIHTAGMSRIPKNEKFPDPTDLKAVYVLCEPVTKYNAPKDFTDVISMSSKAIDFDGNSFRMNFPCLPEFESMVDEFPKGERFSGVAICTLQEDEKSGDIRMNLYNFFPSDEGDQ